VVYYQFYPLLTINFRLESSERCSNGWILSALKNGVQNSIPKKSIKDFKKKIYKKKLNASLFFSSKEKINASQKFKKMNKKKLKRSYGYQQKKTTIFYHVDKSCI